MFCAMPDGIEKGEALALLKPERRAELRERAHETTLNCVEEANRVRPGANRVRPDCHSILPQ